MYRKLSSDEMEFKGIIVGVFSVFLFILHLIFDVPVFVLNSHELTYLLLASFGVTVLISSFIYKDRFFANSSFLDHNAHNHCVFTYRKPFGKK